MNSIQIHRNIRYARAARFGQPSLLAFDGVSQSSERGPISPQAPSRLEMVMGPAAAMRQSEDCQVLSIFTPGRHGKRPVMVWLHGGGFVTGGGEMPWYDGDRLAAEQDVVVVTVTHRLGALGYWHPQGSTGPSPGMADQAVALQWVKTNIADFGGDPENVTVFGQSAGGFSIVALMSWGHGGKLFRRAILQSGGGGLSATRAEAEDVSRMFQDELGQDIHTAGVEEIVAAQRRLAAARKKMADWFPISGDASNAPAVDVIGGWTRDDALPFALLVAGVKPGPGTVETYGPQSAALNAMFEKGCRTLAENMIAGGKRAWLYSFNWSSRESGLGACHCIDLPFLLGSAESWKAAPMLGAAKWPDIDATGARMRKAWANFARGETPGPDWQQGTLTILP